MILSDNTIREYINTETIGVDPRPNEKQIQPASLDVRLGRQFYDLWHDESFQVDEGEAIEIKSGARLLGHTKAVYNMPDHIAAQVSGRSTLGRLFLTVHQTAGWVDPGYEGDITLEIANFSHDTRHLRVGSRVGQMVFFPLDKPSSGYEGQYDESRGPNTAGDI